MPAKTPPTLLRCRAYTPQGVRVMTQKRHLLPVEKDVYSNNVILLAVDELQDLKDLPSIIKSIPDVIDGKGPAA